MNNSQFRSVKDCTYCYVLTIIRVLVLSLFNSVYAGETSEKVLISRKGYWESFAVPFTCSGSDKTREAL